MGQAISSLFGGGVEMPDPPKVTDPPAREEVDEDEQTRNAQLRKLRARSGGVRSTLLGTQLGTSGGSGQPGLLGRSF